MVAAVQPSQPPPLTPEERARVEAYRAQFRAMGLTDAEIDDTSTTDVTTDEAIAYLEGRAPAPWPR